MYSLPVLTWIRFLAWLDIGLLIYFFYSRTHSRVANADRLERRFSWTLLLEFFGVFFIINGVLFGILALLTLTGITSQKSWEEIHLDPGLSIAVCGALSLAGSAMMLAGKWLPQRKK